MNDLSSVPNNHQFTEFFLSQEWFKLNGRREEHNNVLILPKEAFEVPPIIGHGYSEHHAANSWIDNKNTDSKGNIKEMIKMIVPHKLWRQLGAYKALKMNPYYSLYKRNKRR